MALYHRWDLSEVGLKHWQLPLKCDFVCDTQTCPCWCCQCLSGFFGLWKTLPQVHLLVPISSEQTEEAEKEDLRVQLKRHHPSSPLPGSKTSKRPKIKVSLISQGDTAGGPCTPSQGGVPEGEFFLACLKKLSCLKPHNITLLVTTCCTTKPLLQCKMCLEQRGHAVARGTDMDSDLI